jgi:hypothetical protein
MEGRKKRKIAVSEIKLKKAWMDLYSLTRLLFFLPFIFFNFYFPFLLSYYAYKHI